MKAETGATGGGRIRMGRYGGNQTNGGVVGMQGRTRVQGRGVGTNVESWRDAGANGTGWIGSGFDWSEGRNCPGIGGEGENRNTMAKLSHLRLWGEIARNG